jgi:hypothetical protein
MRRMTVGGGRAAVLLAAVVMPLLAIPLVAGARSSNHDVLSSAQRCPRGVHVTIGWGTFHAGRWPSRCWRPYVDRSFFNTPLPAHPRVHRNSQAIVARVLSLGEIKPLKTNPAGGDDYYHPYFFSRPKDPAYTIHCNKHRDRCPIEGRRVRIPASARPASGSDAHMVVIDQRSGWEYDFWNVQTVPLPGNGGAMTIGWGGRTAIVAGRGGGTPATESPAVMSSTGAIGGVIRFQELASGQIAHALFIVVGCTNGQIAYPARDVGGSCRDTTNAPASGQWFQLNMTRVEINALRAPVWQKAILMALAKYGGFVGDTGGNEAFALQLESQETYTSVGGVNPYLAWAARQSTEPRSNILSYSDDGIRRYALNFAAGVDWAHKLRVIDPCVVRRACRHDR